MIAIGEVDKFGTLATARFHEKHETNLPRLDPFTRIPSFKKLIPTHAACAVAAVS